MKTLAIILAITNVVAAMLLNNWHSAVGWSLSIFLCMLLQQEDGD